MQSHIRLSCMSHMFEYPPKLSVDSRATVRDTKWCSEPLFALLRGPMMIALAQLYDVWVQQLARGGTSCEVTKKIE